MPRVFRCPGCGKKLKVPDELAGKKVRCPNCKVALTIPALPPAGVAPRLARIRSAGSAPTASASMLPPPASSLDSLLPPAASPPSISSPPMVTQLVTGSQFPPQDSDGDLRLAPESPPPVRPEVSSRAKAAATSQMDVGADWLAA